MPSEAEPQQEDGSLEGMQRGELDSDLLASHLRHRTAPRQRDLDEGEEEEEEEDAFYDAPRQRSRFFGTFVMAMALTVCHEHSASPTNALTLIHATC